MQAVRYIKSFSKGQITIPKELRKGLGVPDEFWMKIFIDEGRLVVEPVKTPEKDKKFNNKEYLKKLLDMKTTWPIEEESKQFRKEMEDHFKKNSL